MSCLLCGLDELGSGAVGVVAGGLAGEDLGLGLREVGAVFGDDFGKLLGADEDLGVRQRLLTTRLVRRLENRLHKVGCGIEREPTAS